MKWFLILFTVIIILSFGKTLLVPEEFLTIQSAVITASNGDTVSVNFGRPNGKRSTVTTSRILSKQITFEIRDGANKELQEILSQIGYLAKENNKSDSYPPPGWQGARIINDSAHRNNFAGSIRLDRNFRPWIVWHSYEGYGGRLAKEMAYTKWLSDRWDTMRFIENMPDSALLGISGLTFDDNNIPFVTYGKAYGSGYDNIFFTRQINNHWLPEEKIDTNSTENHWWPMIDCNDVQIWCMWFGGAGVAPNYPYNIYVSRWNGNGWQPDTMISPDLGPNEYMHWLPDIVVDGNGHPHCVWAETWQTGRIYYRTFNGSTWEPPLVLNDPAVYSSFEDLDISKDTQDNLYLVWLGYIVSESLPAIFYNVYNHSTGQWSAPVLFKRIYHYSMMRSTFPCIAASSLNDIWILWSEIVNLPTMNSYVSHFNGDSWTTPLQIDPGTVTDWDVGGKPIMLDRLNKPWILLIHWVESNIFDLYYDRFVGASGIEEVITPNKIFLNSKRNITELKNVDIYDITGKKISNISSLSNGIYFVINKNNNKEKRKVVILK